jgi:hypothetical protein
MCTGVNVSKTGLYGCSNGVNECSKGMNGCNKSTRAQGSTPRVGMRFCGHVPNSPRNKNLKRHILNLLEKVVFLDPKRLLSPFCRGKKLFSSTLNVMISQMVRNGRVRFGRHIDIEVSYKILWLEVPRLVPILHYLACFKRGC